MNILLDINTNYWKWRNNNLFFCLFFLLLFLIANVSFSKSIQKITVQPNNRVNIFLDEEIIYTSLLSDNKEKVEINLSSTFFQDNVKDIIVNNGLISSISTFTDNNNTYVAILLSKQLGYTANYLPYSKTISLEVFDWKNLKPSQDALRNGLLALESGLIPEAISSLNTAAQLKSSEGYAYLGLTELLNGEETSGYTNLISAFENRSDIPDVYAALAQIYKSKGETQIANKFSKIFSNLTGITYFDDENFNVENISLISNLNLNYLDKFITESSDLDTNHLSNIVETQDTVKTNSPPTEEQGEILGNFVVHDFLKYLITMAFISAGVIILVYLTKKKKQERILETKDKFKKSLDNAINDIDPEKFKKQKDLKRQLFLRKKEIEQKHKNANKPQRTQEQKPKQKLNIKDIEPIDKEKITPNVVIEDNSEKLKTFLVDFIEAKKREEKQKSLNEKSESAKKREKLETLSFSDLTQQDDFKRIRTQGKKQDIEEKTKTDTSTGGLKQQVAESQTLKTKKLDPKVDLALHIAEKQKQINQEKLNNLSEEKETFPKKNSIEVSGQQTQEKLKQLETNQDLKKSLLDKFKNSDSENE